jgi:hypothetical protein
MRVDQGEISELVRPIEGVFGDRFELDGALPFANRANQSSFCSASRKSVA